MEITLDRLLPGVPGIVRKIRSPEQLKSRLKSFGMVPGTEVRVVYRSPDGGVTALELCGSTMALRTCELKRIRVELI